MCLIVLVKKKADAISYQDFPNKSISQPMKPSYLSHTTSMPSTGSLVKRSVTHDLTTYLVNAQKINNMCLLISAPNWSHGHTTPWLLGTLALNELALPQLPTGLQTAETIFQHVFKTFGFLEDIGSDRGPQFISRVWWDFMEKLGITVSLTSGYHPQANGQMERMNQEIGYLRTYCQDNENDWVRFLPWVEYTQIWTLALTWHPSNVF